MRIIKVLTISLLSLIGTSALAEGNTDAGKSAYTTCAACHGATGEGNSSLKAPRLAHLETVYIVAQLEKFRAGVRGGPKSSSSAQQMAGMAATLASDQAVHDVAAYIATLDAPDAVATLEGDAAVGGDYYNQFCGACHGPSAQGNVALNSPRLSGADDWYLREQLKAFRAGTRGMHPDDRTGKQMRAMAGLLPDDKTVDDVVVFIRDIGGK